MRLDTGAEINKTAVLANLKKITNQIFKLLPNREENIDWETPLATIVEELSGMDKILSAYHDTLFALLCKLNGLYDLRSDTDFFAYRRTIFECLNLLSTLKGEVEACQE